MNEQEVFPQAESLPLLDYHSPVIEDGVAQKCYSKLGEEVLKDSEGWDEVLGYLTDKSLLPNG